MMKKRIAMILAASMMAALPAGTALAEPGAAMEAPQGQGSQGEAPQGGGNEQMPQGGGNEQAPQGQAPQGNGNEQAPQGQAPQGNGSEQAPQGQAPQGGGNEQAPQGQAPQGNGTEQAPQGQAPQEREKGFGRISFEDLLKDGTIEQETYDAITNYMKEHAPQKPEKEQAQQGEQTEDGQRPAEESGDGQKDQNGRPQLPPDEKNPRGEGKGMRAPGREKRPDLLADLLADGVITQEQYDAISAARDEKLAAEKKDTNTDSASADGTAPAETGAENDSADGTAQTKTEENTDSEA